MIARNIVHTIAILAAILSLVACDNRNANVRDENKPQTQEPTEPVKTDKTGIADRYAPASPSPVLPEETPEIPSPEETGQQTEKASEPPIEQQEVPSEWDARATPKTAAEPWFSYPDLDGIAETRLISSERIQVEVRDPRDTYDSLLVDIEQRLSITPDPIERDLVVERWLSPVNTRGYKFNRRKLILYGVEAHYPLGVLHYLDVYYLALGSSIYTLEDSWELSKFSLLADSALTAYLLQDENRL